MASIITGTAFCDKNTWYAGNSPSYAPSLINDGVAGSRWIGTAVDPVASLQNFCGIKFTGLKDLTEVKVNIASWGRNFSIGTWAVGKDPASSTFTKADIIPIRAIDVVTTPTDSDGLAIGINKNVRFALAAGGCPGVLFYCDSNVTSVLSNTPGSPNTNESLNEVSIMGSDSTGETWVKQNGTAICSAQYNDFGTVAAVNDDNVSTGWSGGGVGAGALTDWVAIQFPGVVKPRKVELYFYSWGKTVVLGYTNTSPTAKSDFIVVRTIDVTVTPNDDLGIPWGRTKTNTILLPDTTPTGTIWGVYTNDIGANILGFNGGAVDRVRLMEFVIYGAAQGASSGVNPKPPSTVPVLPFSSTAINWIRTEYSAVGSFSFTPAADTTLLLAVLQGAGAGGRPSFAINGTIPPNDSTLNGADTTITATNLVLTAPGAIGPVAGAVAAYAKGVDWLREVDSGSNGGGGVTGTTCAAGGQSLIQGTVGASFAMAAQLTNSPATSALNTFTGAAAISLSPIYTGTAARNATYGLAVTALNDSVTLNFKGFSGQQLTVPYLNTGTSQFTTTLNGVAIDSATANSGFSRTYTLTTTGDQTLVFTKVNGTAGTLGIGSITFSNYGQAPASSGGAGRTAQIYMLPKPLTIKIGAGGVGQAGGQAVTTAQNGTRGSGGGLGGKGGDGVVVIYEYKGSLLFETPIIPLFPNYNNMTVEPVGVYRTNYIGTGVGTTQNYVHKVRPRTTRVMVLMVGAGGGTVQIVNSPVAAIANAPAIVSAGSKTFTAGSGSSSSRVFSSPEWPSIGGDPGIFSGNGETLYQQNGVSNNTPNQITTGVVNNYGSTGSGVQGAGNGISNSSWVGGSGASAFFILNADDIASGSINIQVPGAGPGGYAIGNPGAVFIFETESGFGTATTQTSQLVLQKTARASTQVTQTAELILQKSAKADIRTTQTAELILVKDNTDVDLQVGNIYATVVFDAGPTSINTTQTSELVLQKSAKASTSITQTSQLVLQKTVRSPYRVTQSSELFLVAETPTIFWLNFGTLDAPARFQLYNSAIGRASSVPANCKIQIEGFFAPGTQLFINGVASGTIASVQNNDRVYIHGGVTNYWQMNMPVYAYYEQNGETARLLVGNWNIAQPKLIPLHTQTYYGSKITPTWRKLHAGFSAAALQSVISKALMSLVQMTTEAVHNLFGSLVDLLQEKTGVNTRIAEVTIGWDMTKALSKVSDTVVWDYVQALSTDVKNVVTWGTLKAKNSEFKQADFIDTKALYGKAGTEYDVRSGSGLSYFVNDGPCIQLSVNYGHFALDSALTQAAYGDYIASEFVDQKAGYSDVKQEFEYNNVDHSVMYTVIYIAVPSSATSRLFNMEPMGTIAYSVLTGMLWDRSTAQGTGHWVIPTDRALHTQAYYGMFAAQGVDFVKAHSEYTQRETMAINGPQQGYFGTTSLWMQSYAAYSERGVIKRTEKVELFDVTPIKTTAQNGVYNLKPFLDMQSVNRIGPASLYKGFDTLADVQAFTENFGGVHTAMKYNGYVYTLDVDKSFICEIFNNGPVKWLLQGG